jgi:hypothetical protein
MTHKAHSKKISTPKNSASAEGESNQVEGPPSASGPTASVSKSESKIEKVVALLQRPEGATLDDLVAATGWQPHTTRAALTGLKKKGHVIDSEKANGVRRYRASKPQ